MKLSVSILEADSPGPTVCIYVTCSLLFNRSNSIDLWTQKNIDDILCHGDRMYLHALTNKMVPDTNSLSIEELPEYRLNYNKFYQGRIDHSFCGDGPFCSLKQVLINAFSDSSNAMLVLDGYVMAVIKKSEFLCLFDLYARNSLTKRLRKKPNIVRQNEVYYTLRYTVSLSLIVLTISSGTRYTVLCKSNANEICGNSSFVFATFPRSHRIFERCFEGF